jgi:hypothetical protein
MGKQYVNGVGIRVTLQRAQHATTEIDDQRGRIRGGQQVSGRWRIRPDHTAGATEYGDSHAH